MRNEGIRDPEEEGDDTHPGIQGDRCSGSLVHHWCRYHQPGRAGTHRHLEPGSGCSGGHSNRAHTHSGTWWGRQSGVAGDQRQQKRGVRSWGRASPARGVMADSVAAGLVGTRMTRRQAERRQGARRTEATESIFPVHTGAALSTRAGRTLVDLHIAEGPWEAHRQLRSRTKREVPTEGKGTPCSTPHSCVPM